MTNQDVLQESNGRSDTVLADIQRYFAWPLNRYPTKVVSLVPSITDSLMHFGLEDTLVGITSYCPEPQGVRPIQRVGGPASINIEGILSLSPDLVIGGLEENSPHELLKLGDAGIPLWIVFPKTVDETIAFLYQLAEGFCAKRALQQIRSLEVSVTYLRLSGRVGSSNPRYFCPIWHEKTENEETWMVFDDQTYASDLLSLFGAKNCFGIQESQSLEKQAPISHNQPSMRDTRYYKVSTEDVIEANPSLILLPSEPYHFDQSYLRYLKHKFRGVIAVEQENIHLIDGKLIFWYGTRLGQALQELPSYFF